MLVWLDAKEAPFYLMRPNHFVIWGFAVFCFSWIKHFLYKTLNYFGTYFSYSCLWEVKQNPLLRRKKIFSLHLRNTCAIVLNLFRGEKSLKLEEKML